MALLGAFRKVACLPCLACEAFIRQSPPLRHGYLFAGDAQCSVDGRAPKRRCVAFDGEVLLFGESLNELKAGVAIGQATVWVERDAIFVSEWRGQNGRSTTISPGASELTEWFDILRKAARAEPSAPVRIQQLRRRVMDDEMQIDDLKVLVGKITVKIEKMRQHHGKEEDEENHSTAAETLDVTGFTVADEENHSATVASCDVTGAEDEFSPCPQRIAEECGSDDHVANLVSDLRNRYMALAEALQAKQVEIGDLAVQVQTTRHERDEAIEHAAGLRAQYKDANPVDLGHPEQQSEPQVPQSVNAAKEGEWQYSHADLVATFQQRLARQAGLTWPCDLLIPIEEEGGKSEIGDSAVAGLRAACRGSNFTSSTPGETQSIQDLVVSYLRENLGNLQRSAESDDLHVDHSGSDFSQGLALERVNTDPDACLAKNPEMDTTAASASDKTEPFAAKEYSHELEMASECRSTPRLEGYPIRSYQSHVLVQPHSPRSQTLDKARRVSAPKLIQTYPGQWGQAQTAGQANSRTTCLQCVPQDRGGMPSEPVMAVAAMTMPELNQATVRGAFAAAANPTNLLNCNAAVGSNSSPIQVPVWTGPPLAPFLGQSNGSWVSRPPATFASPLDGHLPTTYGSWPPLQVNAASLALPPSNLVKAASLTLPPSNLGGMGMPPVMTTYGAAPPMHSEVIHHACPATFPMQISSRQPAVPVLEIGHLSPFQQTMEFRDRFSP